MKKLFKIIPLTCMATTAMSIAPLMTSCSQETKYIFDLTDPEYDIKPSKVASDGKPLLRNTATEAYLNMVKEDPKQFIYDYMYGHNKFVHAFAKKQGAEITTYTVNSTLPKFGSTNVSYAHYPDMTYPTVSFAVEGHLEITSQIGEAKTDKLTFVIDYKVKYTNTIFYVYQDEERGTINQWTVGMMDPAEAGRENGSSMAYLYSDTPWSIDFRYNCDATTSYTDPITEVVQTSTQNYNFAKNFEDYYTLNDALLTAHDYLYSGSTETLPLGLMWMLIPMDFSSEAFMIEDDPISSGIEITFMAGCPTEWAWIPDAAGTPRKLQYTMTDCLMITGGVDPTNIDFAETSLLLIEKDNKDVYIEFNQQREPSSRSVTFGLTKSENQKGYFNLIMNWQLTEQMWKTLAEEVKKAPQLTFSYLSGSMDIKVKNQKFTYTDNFKWEDKDRQYTMDFTKVSFQ